MTPSYKHHTYCAASASDNYSGKGRRNRNSSGRFRILLGKCTISVITVLVLLFIAAGPVSSLFSNGAAVAQAGRNYGEIQYRIIEIRKGDSLWSIANENISPGFSDIYTYINEIKSCNQLQTDDITSGSYLMIPFYEPESSDYASAD